MKWGNISAQKLKSERSNSFAVSILLQTKDVGGQFRVRGLENIPQVPGNLTKVGQNHDARKAVLAILSVLKWSRAIFRPRSGKVSVHKNVAVSISLQTKAITTYLNVQGTGNIPQVTGNPPEASQNHDGFKGVSATLSVLR